MAQQAGCEIEVHEILADDDRAVVVTAHFGEQRLAVEIHRHEMVEHQAAHVRFRRNFTDLVR